MNEHEYHPVYEEYLEASVQRIQRILAEGNISTDKALIGIVKECCYFCEPDDAFKFFNQHCPYSWEKHVTATTIERFNFDLYEIVLSVVNSVIFADVWEKLCQQDCYRFLSGIQKRKSLNLKTSERVVFEEYWKSEANNYIPSTMIPVKYDGKDLWMYKQEFEDPILYIMQHTDPSLVWIGKTVIPAPEKDLSFFEENMIEYLQRSKCPPCEIEHIQIQRVLDFQETGKNFSFDPLDQFNLHGYHYVLQHVDEDGYTDILSGFSNEIQFEKACQTISEFLQHSVAA